jgi:hypothetical protein
MTQKQHPSNTKKKKEKKAFKKKKNLGFRDCKITYKTYKLLVLNLAILKT